jgi:hypothetical protein
MGEKESECWREKRARWAVFVSSPPHPPWRLASKSRASGECPPATSYLPTSTSKRVLGVPSCCALFAACVLTVSCVMCCVALCVCWLGHAGSKVDWTTTWHTQSRLSNASERGPNACVALPWATRKSASESISWPSQVSLLVGLNKHSRDCNLHWC